jgi:alkylhydroperoxidase family enzyme
MTWLEGVPDGDRDWDRLAALCPEAFETLADLVRAAWKDTDPVLFELARLRIASLLGSPVGLVGTSAVARASGLSDGQAAELSSWPSSPRFTARDRACLAITEQFVMDANTVTDEQVCEVTDHLGAAGCYAFVEAISVLETFQRACLTLGIRTWPGIDGILSEAGSRDLEVSH